MLPQVQARRSREFLPSALEQIRLYATQLERAVAPVPPGWYGRRGLRRDLDGDRWRCSTQDATFLSRVRASAA